MIGSFIVYPFPLGAGRADAPDEAGLAAGAGDLPEGAGLDCVLLGTSRLKLFSLVLLLSLAFC